MARKKKRRLLRGTVLMGAGAGVVAALRRKPAAETLDTVKPDDSPGDPLVEEQTERAAAEAGSVGGNVQQMAADEPGFPTDPEMRPVEEAAGNDAEAAEQVDAERGANRETSQ